MNPHAPANAIAVLLNSNMEAVFYVDNWQNTPLDYAIDYNGVLIGMVNQLFFTCRMSQSVGHESWEYKRKREKEIVDLRPLYVDALFAVYLFEAISFMFSCWCMTRGYRDFGNCAI